MKYLILCSNRIASLFIPEVHRGLLSIHSEFTD